LVEGESDRLIVRMRGELDLSTAADLADVIERHCAGTTRLTIDLSELSFLDCAGLRVLLDARARAEGSGGDLLLIPGHDSVQRVFRLAGLEERLPFAALPSRE
jgi:anti-sigma B factor antagonist